MTPRLGFLESLGYGLALAVTLTMALAHSPLWRFLGDIGFLLPARYIGLLAALPVSTNTAFAFFVLLALAMASLVLLQHPVVGLSSVTASVFLISAYPFAHIRWHHLLFSLFGARLPLPFEAPGVADWVYHLLPLLVLMAGPLLVQVRTLTGAYRTKGAPDADLALVRRHLARVAAIDLAVAVAVAVAMGILLFALLPDLATATHIFSKNSVPVMIAVAFLLVAAIGVGTGLFRRRGTEDPTPLDTATQAGWAVVRSEVHPPAYDAPPATPQGGAPPGEPAADPRSRR